MNSAHTLDSSDAFTIEGLDEEAMSATDEEIRAITCADETADKAAGQSQPRRQLVIKGSLPGGKEKSSSAVTTVEAVEQPEASPDSAEATKVSRTDIVKILEGFVGLIRSGDDGNALGIANQISFEPRPTQIAAVAVNEKVAEVNELKALLMEAQSTIITLLTDRVDDRARIASLETQIHLLPDLQAQADRAMSAAINTDDLREELNKVKLELSKVRSSKVRADVGDPEQSLIVRLKCWLFQMETNKLR